MSDRDDELAVTRALPQTPENTTPAADLGELWQVLDTLPQADPPEDLLATTIEMVAVRATSASSRRPGGSGGRLAAVRRDLWQWLTPAAVVLAAILVGFWLGQATAIAPPSDRDRAEWRARRDAALRESLKNDPAARRLWREKLHQAEEVADRPPGARPVDNRRPRPPNPPGDRQSRKPAQRAPFGSPEKPAKPRRKLLEPRGERGAPSPAPPAAVPAAKAAPSPPSPPAA